MAERSIDEFLGFLPLGLEERRTLKVLLSYEKPLGAEEIRNQYERMFGVKIGTKIYHVLNNLKEKGYVAKEFKNHKKTYPCNREKIAVAVKDALREEEEKIRKAMDKMEFMLGKPSLTTHVGIRSVEELFIKITEKLKEGCELHTIKDTMHYPIKPEESIDKKTFVKEENKLMNILCKNRKSGKSKEYYIVEKEKSENAIMSLAKELGKDYIRKSLRQIIELLDLENFNIVFGKDLEFKFFVVPDYCAVTAWFSSPKQYLLDRAIAFWYPDDIKGLDEYFWDEWRGILGNKTEFEAKEEVKKWAVELLKKI